MENYELMTRISELEEALAFYADSYNYYATDYRELSPILQDNGEKAKAVLKSYHVKPTEDDDGYYDEGSDVRAWNNGG